MALKKIMESIPEELKQPHDEEVFKILIRTLKETGRINYFKSLETIVNRCYWSRKEYALSNRETIWQNISLWIGDIAKHEGGLIVSLNNPERTALACIYRTNLINHILSKHDICAYTIFNHLAGAIIESNKNGALKEGLVDFDKVILALDKSYKLLKAHNEFDNSSTEKNLGHVRLLIEQAKYDYGNTKNNRK